MVKIALSTSQWYSLGFFLSWLFLLIEAINFAPRSPPETMILIQTLLTNPFGSVNPAIIMIFYLMGIWPFIYLGLLLAEIPQQKLPTWIFLVGALFLGAYVLIPYFVLHQRSLVRPDDAKIRIKAFRFIDNRWFGICLISISLVFLVYGIGWGNWVEYFNDYQMSGFIHIMTWDFCALTVIAPVIIYDDMRRRDWFSPTRLLICTHLPFFGSLIYLIWRPRFQTVSAQLETNI